MSSAETVVAIEAAMKDVNERIARIEKALARLEQRANGPDTPDTPAPIPGGHERGTKPQRAQPR